MKFLCDRCKTRYSIGDERVRGKILKIRCKNCANVITVREGMMSDPDGPELPTRPKKATTPAPEAVTERAEPRGAGDPARGIARAGAQPGERGRSGAEASRVERRPVASPERVDRSDRSDPVRVPARIGTAGAAAGAGQGKRAGLDDARPAAGRAAAAPRPDPVHAAPSNALGAAFASAMTKPPPALDEEWYVSIDGEQSGPFSLAEAQQWVAHKSFDAELYCWSEGFDDWLPVDKVSHFRGLRKRPAPTPIPTPPPVPRIGGVAQRAAVAPKVAKAPADDEPKPLFAATMASLERAAPAVPSQPLPVPAPTTPARATPPFGTAAAPRSNGASAVARQPAAPPVDTFDTSESGESKTEIEAVPYRDPSLSPARSEPPASTTLHGTGANPAITAPPVSEAASDFGDFEGDEELAIGEVSRVVKLGDIVKSRGPSAVLRRTGAIPSVGRSTGAEASLGSGARPTFRATGAIASMTGAEAAAEGAPLPEGDPGATIAPVATSHRRGLITLLSVSGVLVLGVIGAVVLFVTTDDDPTGGRLGQVRDIDTLRPEDPITHRPIEPATQTPPNPFSPPRPHPRVPTLPPVTRDPDPPAGDSLNPEEIEDTARKHQDTTQRCYMRSQRGADAIIVGDVKKISVTLTIDGEGNVSDVKLSDHAADNLGKCLVTTIRGWKFRPSRGGLFRFSLNFVGG